MKNAIKFWMLMVSVALFLASCTVNDDNPVIPEPVNPETPEQLAFWAQFDAWQTDSCTLGDDYFMHTIGTWWNNPVDIYPNGLMLYAARINDQRVDAIVDSNPDLQHLKTHAYGNLTMSEEELMQMVNKKVEELWAGATTREEALEAMGRAWAEGYTLFFDPMVDMIDDVPTWQLELKVPSYVNVEHLYKYKELVWRALAKRKSARKVRRAPTADNGLASITKGLNIGVGQIEIADDLVPFVQNALAGQWSTVEGIKEDIEKAVYLLDGVLVDDKCIEEYNYYLSQILPLHEWPTEVTLTRSGIAYDVVRYMGNIYALNDYNRLYISPQARQQYADWCEKFREVMRQQLEVNTWLENETRQSALDKLDKIVFYVGGVDVIPDCVIPTLTGNNVVEDVRQLRIARMDGFRWAVTQTRSTVSMLLENLMYFYDQTIDNANYFPYKNIVVINPSNLLEPYVQDDYEDALQWAFIATTVGHELTHGFDSDGSQYDQWGNLKNWWTEADAAKFQTMCDQLTDQYNHLQLMPWADPTLYGDGENTLAENMADLGGCCLGLQILLDQHPNATDAEKQALTRRYFQGWAIQWSASYNLDFVREMKTYDVHSQARERTNGVVRNVDAWYDSYGITSGTLYLAPADRVRIW